MATNNGVVNIRGKDYKTVAARVSEFIKAHPEWAIETGIHSIDREVVVMWAKVKDETGRVRGTGYAEEFRAASNINKTSAVENCETSAIGRALACVGHAGTEYASANEVSNAIIQQEVQNATARILAHNTALTRNIDTVMAVKEMLANNKCTEAVLLMQQDIPEEDKKALWLAPTKGGIFTTEEREKILTPSKYEAE